MWSFHIVLLIKLKFVQKKMKTHLRLIRPTLILTIHMLTLVVQFLIINSVCLAQTFFIQV